MMVQLTLLPSEHNLILCEQNPDEHIVILYQWLRAFYQPARLMGYQGQFFVIAHHVLPEL